MLSGVLCMVVVHTYPHFLFAYSFILQMNCSRQ
uniref:Uncharacterized protein n=1 Tax=Anguilla anguilla TaxID=7936 RepID=A0A0E9T4H4_ANGAN